MIPTNSEFKVKVPYVRWLNTNYSVCTRHVRSAKFHESVLNDDQKYKYILIRCPELFVLLSLESTSERIGKC